MIEVCLLFDSAHAAEGWLCCRSIRAHEPEASIHVLCLDDEVLEQAHKERVDGVPLADLEFAFPALAEVKKSRQWPAYTQTCKVFLPTHLFKTRGLSSLCYVDSDMYFWGSIREVESALADLSFMVASREDPIRPAQGDFNGGFFACRNNTQAQRFLSWWQDRTLEWCEWRPGPGGRFTEEGYLNILNDDPKRFSGTGRCHHPGINLARWNVGRHRLSLVNGCVFIDETWNLVCFHFQGFKPAHEAFGLGALPKGVMRFICEKYRCELLKAIGGEMP